MIRRPPGTTLFPTRRSSDLAQIGFRDIALKAAIVLAEVYAGGGLRDRKSTRLNSSHGYISYAVFCLKKKKWQPRPKPAVYQQRRRSRRVRRVLTHRREQQSP